MQINAENRSSAVPYALFSFVTLCYIAIYYVLGEQTHITVWDGLDGFHIPTLVHSGYLFAKGDVLVPHFFNGIPRWSLASELNFSTFIFTMLSPFHGIILCKAVSAAIAFIGTTLLLSRHVFQDDNPNWVIAGASACMATLPTWFIDISSATVPLLLNAFLNIRLRRNSYWDWLIIATMPIFTSFVLLGIFLVLMVGTVFLYDLVRTRKLNWRFAFAIFLYGIFSICCEYRLMLEVLFPTGFLSQRIEFKSLPNVSLAAALQVSKALLFKGQEHVQSLHRSIVLPMVCIALFFWRRHKRLARIMTLLLSVLVVSALLNGILTWEPIANTYERLFAFFPVPLRFYWMYPAFWYVLFAIALYILSTAAKYARYFTFVIILSQLFLNFQHHEHFKSLSEPSFSEFYAQRQFSEVKNFIGLPQSQYQVVSVGIYPSVASYNGFYALDGYFSMYPLAYKREFRQIIAPELDRSPRAAAYFDGWGSRVYVFSSELFPSYIRSKDSGQQITLNLNYEKLYAMGCRYIISSVPVVTTQTPQLSFQRTFPAADSYWDIYLYKVLP